MANLKVDRSVQLVSLDTHPANNALVVTYEISVRLLDHDKSGGQARELATRSKRDRLQIKVSALDKLSEDELRSDKLMINLETIGREMLRKCPLLQTANEGHLWNIQLHLLYLVNRRQAQLQSVANTAGANLPLSVRPFSRKGRSSASSSSSSSSSFSTHLIDVYSGKTIDGDWLDTFLDQLDDYLEPLERKHLQQTSKVNINNIDLLLEGLYGDEFEQSHSIAAIRLKLKGGPGELRSVSSNNLLVCAIVRTLRDRANQEISRLQLLYCLIRLTSFEDLYCRLSNLQFSIQQVGLLQDLLKELTLDWSHRQSAKDEQQVAQHEPIVGQLLYAESLLLLLINLLSLDPRELTGELLAGGGDSKQQSTIGTLVEMLQLASHQLTRDIRLMNKLDRSLKLLGKLVCLLRHLSTVKEFVVQMRNKQLSSNFIDALLALLATLQLSRPASGVQQDCPDYLANDRFSLNELYTLELQVIQLATNLLYDRRLRLRLMAKNLLKCVLRNLVVLLASRRANSLGPFHESPVLLVPLKCLYELSCEFATRMELHKSKIIIKCLFEYLLSVTLDFKIVLESSHSIESMSKSSLKGASFGGGRSLVSKSNQEDANQADDSSQIVIDASSASHYVLSIWVNLSTIKTAPMYDGREVEFSELLSDYVHLCIDSLELYCSHWLAAKSNKRSIIFSQHPSILIYLELKLLRNLTQFVRLNAVIDDNKIGVWTSRLGPLTRQLLEQASLAPFAVECLAALSNLIPYASSLDGLPAVTFVLERLSRLATGGGYNGRNNRDGDGAGSGNDEDEDDLMLVSINYLAILASSSRLDICDQFGREKDDQQVVCNAADSEQPDLTSKLIEACGFILAAKGNDYGLILACLCALNQLMSHSVFLRQLSALFNRASYGGGGGGRQMNKNKSRPLSVIIGQLADRLVELMFHGRQEVAKMANRLLSGLRQLEQQASCPGSANEDVQIIRFAGYNCNWLAAIAAGRDADLIGSDSELLETHESKYGDLNGDSEFVEEDEELELEEFGQVRHLGSNRLAPLSSRLIAKECPTDSEEDLNSGNGDDDDDDDDNSDLNGGVHRAKKGDRTSELEGDDCLTPDLNVIDANSMVKHLIKRREFRSEWLRR